jgi:alkylhydroperoxidase/carboxymuconolactone decarboxylase family protein YurZ
MNHQDAGAAAAAGLAKGAGPFGPAFAQLSEWDPAWAKACVRAATNPWTDGALPCKTIELISIGLNAAGAKRNADGARRHIRAALEVGASRDEILAVLEFAAATSLHACDQAALILLDEARVAGLTPDGREQVQTPAGDKIKAIGQWSKSLEPLHELDPEWTNGLATAMLGLGANRALPPKLSELLGVALEVSNGREPGVRRRIAAALALGVGVPEITDVLKLCAVQGFDACNLGVPILAEELCARLPAQEPAPQERSERALTPTAVDAADGEGAVAAEPKRGLKEKAFQEMKRFLMMFSYLWIILGLFVLLESIVLAEHHINYKNYGFAFVNAFVLAKVMLLADNMRLGAQFKDRPLVVPILIKSYLFSAVFISFHILEKVVVGAWEGKPLIASVPAMAGGAGSLMGTLVVALILSVALIPFFAFSEISRVMERGEFAKLIFTLNAKSDQRARRAGNPG